jgi:phospholipase/carboxylesterase
VFIGAGKRDPLIPSNETKELIKDLEKANAAVEEYWVDGGHQLVREEVEKAKEWFEANYN